MVSVHIYIEACDGVILLKDRLSLCVKHFLNCITFWLMKIKVIGDVPLRDDESMMLSNWEGVPDGKAKLILSDDAPSGYLTEDTVRRHIKLDFRAV